MKAGIGMTDRSFECILCQQKFTRFGSDAFLLSENLVCDECLMELQPLDDGALRKQVSERLSKNPSRPSQEFENEVVRIIQKFSQRGKGE